MADPGREIIKAAKKGSLEGVKSLLATDSKLVHARDQDGSTPLHCAVWKGHQEVAAALIAAGAILGTRAPPEMVNMKSNGIRPVA